MATTQHSLEGRVVVITGASSGIGEHTARTLVHTRGARVVVAARSIDKLQQISEELGGAEKALAVQCDVTKRDDHQRLLKEAIDHFGRVDAWVNNAGLGISRSVLDLTDEEFDQMLLVNTKSHLYGMQTVMPYFFQENRGHLINVSSILGRIPHVRERSAYCAAKHALNSLTCSLRLEVRAKGPEYDNVHVSLVSPGLVATDFGVRSIGGGYDSRAMPGAQPVEEVADVIVDVLEKPRADEYTRPQYRQMIGAYFSADRVEDAEARPPFTGWGQSKEWF